MAVPARPPAAPLKGTHARLTFASAAAGTVDGRPPTRSIRGHPRPLPHPLAERLTGEVIAPDHAGYDAARRVWNGMIDKRPAAIARCADADDVAAAVRFAARARAAARRPRRRPQRRGHRRGRRRPGDRPVRDARRPRSTPPAARCTSQGGATWADVDRVTAPLGLATPGGVVSETGVAGLALSGGVSHQRRRDGMTIDNLVSAEVVLADGRQRPRERRRAPRPVLGAARRRRQLRRRHVVRAAPARARARGLRAQRRLPDRGRRARARGLARRGRRRAGRAVDRRASSGRCRSSTSCPSSCAALPYVGVAGMWAGDPAEGERATRRAARARDPAARHERARRRTSTSSARWTRSSRRACAATGRRSTSTASPTPRSTPRSTGRTAGRRTTRWSSSATAAGRSPASAPRRPRSATAARSGC